jgi:polyisoprenoid-binding protein YceI
MTSTLHQTESRSLPQPGTWTIDASHSSVEFIVRHLMVSKVRGRFDDVSGDIHVAERPEDSDVAVSIATASVSTGDPQRDGHLVSPDFFDAEQYPAITYRSTAVRLGDDGALEVDGELSVHGVTRPVQLKGEYFGVARDPWGNDRVGFSAATELDREDFGLTWNQTLETGGVLVGKKARIELEIEAARADA